MTEANYLQFERISMEHVKQFRPAYKNTPTLARNIKFLLACRSFGPNVRTIQDISDDYYRPENTLNSLPKHWDEEQIVKTRESLRKLMKGRRAGPRPREVSLLKSAFDTTFPEFKDQVTERQIITEDVPAIIRRMAEIEAPTVWTLKDPVLVLRAMTYMYPPVDIKSATILSGSRLLDREKTHQRFPITEAGEVLRYSELETETLSPGDDYEITLSGPSSAPIILETSIRTVETDDYSEIRALKLDAIKDRGARNWLGRIEPDRMLQASDLVGEFDIHIIAGYSGQPQTINGSRLISNSDLTVWVNELRQQKLTGAHDISLTFLSYEVRT